MARYTPQNFGGDLAPLSPEFEKIKQAIDDTLSRTGDAPNAMTTPLDMNSERILNLPEPKTANEPARLKDIQAESGLPVQDSNAGKYLQTDGSAATWQQVQATDVQDDSSRTVQDTVTKVDALTVATVADAKALEVPVGIKVVTSGYYEAGDGGGNDYIVVAGGTGTDDGGSFIDMDNGLQLFSIFSNNINVLKFGAKGAGINDDTSAIQAAINYSEFLSENGVTRGGTVYLPEGQYLVSETLVISKSRVSLEGAGRYNTVLLRRADYGDTIFVGDGLGGIIEECRLKGLMFNSAVGGTLMTYGSHIQLEAVTHGSIEDFALQRGYKGVLIRGGADLTLKRGTISGSGIANNSLLCGIQLDGLATAEITLPTQIGIHDVQSFGGIYKYNLIINAGEQVNIGGKSYFGNAWFHNILIEQTAANYEILNLTFGEDVYIDGTLEESTFDGNSVFITGQNGDGSKDIFSLSFIGTTLRGQGGDSRHLIRVDGTSRGGVNDQVMHKLNIIGCDLAGSNDDAVRVGGGTLINIKDNNISGSNINNNLSGVAGIDIGSNCDRVTVNNNIVGSTSRGTGTGNSDYGIRVRNGATNVSLLGNDVVHNIISGIIDLSEDASPTNFKMICNNQGYNPGTASVPVPASGSTIVNPTGHNCFVSVFGGSVSDIKLDGQTVASTTGVKFPIPSGGTVTLSYTSAPSWVWWRQ